MFEEYSGNEDRRVGIESIDEDRIFKYITCKRAGPETSTTIQNCSPVKEDRPKQDEESIL